MQKIVSYLLIGLGSATVPAAVYIPIMESQKSTLDAENQSLSKQQIIDKENYDKLVKDNESLKSEKQTLETKIKPLEEKVNSPQNFLNDAYKAGSVNKNDSDYTDNVEDGSKCILADGDMVNSVNRKLGFCYKETN